MTVVKLFKIDEPEETLAAVFDDGDHFIGRATYLPDKRISRKHGLLKVSEAGVTLTAIHQNPCYYKSEAGHVAMLSKGESITLRNKDVFSFLKDDLWLKIVISEENQSASTSNLCNKRKNSFDIPGTSRKIAKTDVANVTNGTEPGNIVALDQIKEEPVTDDSVSAATTVNNISSVQTEEINQIPESTVEPNINRLETANSCASGAATVISISRVKTEDIKQEPESTDESPTNKSETINCCANGAVKVENDEQSSELPTPTTGNEKTNAAGKDAGVGDKNAKKTKRSWRDRCWYGKSCYRKNQEHKASFSHPGDSDYETDPDDDRPSCSYGNSCYRRNPTHRRDYKHPSNGGPKPKLKKLRTKPTAKKQAPTTSDDYVDAEDDYDLEDPFIDDDSEDDFQPEDDDDDDTDSEWADSQEFDDDENTKQLLKEAKRITRNKGKK